jgi:BRICHOS domain
LIGNYRHEHIRRFLREFLQQLQQNQDGMFNEANKVRELEALNPNTIGERFFKEDVEVGDDDSDSYTDITVPDFKDGRSGRFIHDFVNNFTTIVDATARRCFIYPLDRETVLAPKSLAEVMMKMQQK